MVEKTDWLSDDELEGSEGDKVLQTVEAVAVAVDTDSLADSEFSSTKGEEEDGIDCEKFNSDDESNRNEDINTTKNCTNSTETSFEAGDHVYSWCSFLGIPNVYTHHGIVIDRDDSAGTVTILDFSCLVDDSKTHSEGSSCTPRSSVSTTLCQSSTVAGSLTDDGKPIGSSISNNDSILRSYTIEESSAQKVWHKVKYHASWTEKYLTRRAGTVSMGGSDPVKTVLARADFLVDHQTHLLTAYHLTKSNCEHVAVWCKTGHFSSLQLLSGMGHSLALSTVPTIGAATATTTVPAAGLWGWLGYTTAVPLASVVPWLLPLAVLPSAISAGMSAFDVKRWKHTTDLWNATFAAWRQTTADVSTLDKPEVYTM